MPTPQVKKFTLTPHPVMESGRVRSIGGEVLRTQGMLRVSYVLEGGLQGLRVPESRAPRFADELWRQTCFEMFIARQGEPSYHELNFSPSGEWAVYAFARYRERVPLDGEVDFAAIDPCVTVRRLPDKLELMAQVTLDFLSPRYAGGRLMLALSAVVESVDGQKDLLSYWALKHPLAKPDFHHPDAFVLEFDEIRN